ncbi:MULTISPECIES: DUF2851 family protein [Sphingobacterium]|uniref:DUF2851 family protein n=1 Tax=Sphingobacterium TaxID=28453 RepID=UPI0013DCE5BA|nr:MULTISPECIES: DUF2851 family protein [unclassified Sphingobacterium]
MVYPEELLHFIWRYRLYGQTDLKTRDGEELKVIHTGVNNHNAGPDFELAKIQIGKTVWSGHVEIHFREDDWFQHKHDTDPAYCATILHVVWEEGSRAGQRQDETQIPTLRLKDYVDPQMLARYASLTKQQKGIACEGRMKKAWAAMAPGWLERLAIERLQDMYGRCEDWLVRTNKDWEAVFLINLGRAFGTNVNAQAFEELMWKVPPQLLYRYYGDSQKISALLFGTAGFLEADCTDEYFVRLKGVYQHLKKLHGLDRMSAVNWKFMRMRPHNFPTYRLAQLSALISTTVYWFDMICNVSSLDALFATVKKGRLDAYWQSHFHFASATEQHGTGWTDAHLYHLAINCFIPMLFSYGHFMGREDLKERALGWLAQIPAENNHVVRYYKQQGVVCYNAGDSQALLALRRNYCDPKKCLDCAVGMEVLKS